ncbi:hypothetical protein PSP6_270024 [Paraburkholderia tropica]|uniref:response regulator n=1 Tax=Paraburkholderia tropica TaxID=92647 RepID=UPI001CB3A9A5|nr:response regulator [Paraburkholderia tropica]CAG9207504.1 hypothetical protein PSP6_270024 [Paraburkholderia tropica]
MASTALSTLRSDLPPGVQLLSKPYSRIQLAAKVRQVLGNNETETPHNDAGAGARDRPRERSDVAAARVLVVEDDIASLDAICELLTLIGIESERAAGASAALDALVAERFDILLTDVAMPHMSGFELARRATVIRPGIGIIFASGDPVPDQDLAFTWTALRKPFTLEQLRAALQAVVS